MVDNKIEVALRVGLSGTSPPSFVFGLPSFCTGHLLYCIDPTSLVVYCFFCLWLYTLKYILSGCIYSGRGGFRRGCQDAFPHQLKKILKIVEPYIVCLM